MSADETGPSADRAGDPGLLTTVVSALYESGWALDVDWDLETFDVLPRDGEGEPLLGVVMSHSRAVAFYRVHPEHLPVGARAAVAAFVTRQNTLLVTSAFELNLDTGNLSLRSGFAFPDMELDLPVVQAILDRLVCEVEAVHERTQPELESVIARAIRVGATPTADDPPTPEDHA
ncbi:hypothetical protein SAMN05216410_1983 [Sanguibacter gelidistatuariae]|uniref:Sensory transduction regulator n=1 Tax=Sanguibacter gelidistatuariae TaxID=1814289 RepID=A0A1G6MVU0_9MICO|nr:hypothetical protein [Sanguibacter gelidistatuariae]SDC59551.1 hypothetical protein SAMN05216410_1983 [Sanguibacter gelidistatuariae]